VKPKKTSPKPKANTASAWQGSGRVESVLFIFGRPGPADLKAKLREWAVTHNREEAAVYLEFMSKKLTDFCESTSEGGSPMDYLISRICEHPMKVEGAEITWYGDSEMRPALRLQGGSIRSRTSEPGTVAYLDNQDFVNLLTNALCLLFQVERVTAWIVYDEFIPWSQLREVE
jgi:hypothetical protein